ncbi:MAG TPA: hypothetical protein VHG51_04535 [Longimicrobiaceae bacterium]|nr:hypothetical protein [Longimicrobiaceae bacterium]
MTPIRIVAKQRFLALAAVCLLAAACDEGPTGPGGGEVPRRYAVVPIELPDGLPAAAMGPAGMNAAGQVVLGTFYLGRTFALWSGGGVTTFAAPYTAFATGLNDVGQVVGCTGSVFGEGEQRPLLGEAGRLWYLAGAGLERACAHDINNDGVVVGESRGTAGSRAFVLADGRVAFVSVPGDTAAVGVAVNGPGHVAVNSSRTLRKGFYVSSLAQASLWRDGELVPLGRLDWSPAGAGQVADLAEFSHTAVDLNDRDEVVGTSNGSVCTPDGNSCHTRWRAFLWRNGRMTDLGSERPGDNSSAVAINRWGQVLVVVYEGNTPKPFLWSDGRLHDLNETVAGTGWRLVNVVDLNDAGQVVAIAAREGAAVGMPVRLDPV